MTVRPRIGRPWRARVREFRIVARAALDPYRPLLVHIIPMRRCNLACAYCNEYDHTSRPVPAAEMFERIDRLAALGTAVVTIGGGEPLLHPALDALIRRIHDDGMVATLITNGVMLSVDRIQALNASGLDRIQISIDNVKPDAVSRKSLQLLDRKLVDLAKHASFDVNINCVVGAGVAHSEDALVIARRARELGFTTSMGIIHNGEGRLKPLSPQDRKVYRAIQRLNRRSITSLNQTFQNNLAAGRPNGWRCRAGARYFYVCEDGLVHYCSQQRGAPAIPLRRYTPAHIGRAHAEQKACAPFCTLACSHQASLVDRWRGRQRLRSAGVTWAGHDPGSTAARVAGGAETAELLAAPASSED